MAAIAKKLPAVSRKTDKGADVIRPMNDRHICNFDLVVSTKKLPASAKKYLRDFNFSKSSLTETDQDWLRRLVKKTSNVKRRAVLTGSDPRGLHGYLKHARMEIFPKKLWMFAYITNAEIKKILRS